MKSSTWILAGLTLAGGTALALQETGTQEQYDPESSVVTEEEQQDRTDSYGSSTATQESDPYSTQTEDDAPSGDPEMGTLPEGETNAYGAETGEQSGQDVTQMSPEELMGMTVTTSEGEELGTIEQVGYSTTRQEQVATLNVGGFLGVGEKLIAVPLSELQVGSDDSLITTMSREEIQSEPEFDPAELSTEGEQQQDW